MENDSRTIKSLMDQILLYRQEIYGLLAIWIILFHVSNRVPVPGDPGVIGPLIRMGNVCVDVFLFLSGYCVCKSYERKNSLGEFYKRRLLRVVIPYLIISIPLYLWKDGFETGWNFNLNGFIGDIITYNFWIRGMQTTWFVCAIMLFYLLFPVLYAIVKRSRWSGVCLTVFVFLLNILLGLKWTGYKNTMIAWARLPVFILGISTYVNSDIELSRKHIMMMLAISIVFSVIFPIRERYSAFVGNRYDLLFLSYLFLTPGVLMMSAGFVSILHVKVKRFFSLAGQISLELYMIHVFLLRIFDYYHVTEYLNGLCYLVIPLLSILCGYLYLQLKRSFAHKGKIV